MESPGAYLKRERELRGITLKGVHDAIRVPLRFLEALEADEYESLPHPTFVKGFIKTYCKHLGLDEVDAVLRFEIFMKDRAEKTEKPERPGKPETKRVVSSVEKSPSNFRAVIPFAVAGVVIIIFLAYMGYSRKEAAKAPPEGAVETQAITEEAAGTAVVKEGASSPEAKPAGEAAVSAMEAGSPDEHPTTTTFQPSVVASVPKPTEAAKALKEGAKTAETLPQIDKRHTLTATARETVWIKIRLDDGEPYDVMLKEGESVSWKAARVFSLIVGNAGGVSISYDGKSLPPMGKSGEVVSFKIPEEKPLSSPAPAATPAPPAPAAPPAAPAEKAAPKPSETSTDKAAEGAESGPADKAVESPAGKPAQGQ